MRPMFTAFTTPTAAVIPSAARLIHAPPIGIFLCVYVTAVSLSLYCPFPRNSHLVVSNPSTPTGPRACMRDVEMPTSAPRPNRNPSLNRVDALWNTHAESTLRKNSSARALSFVMMQSVCDDPFAWMYSIASSMESTISTVSARVPYSCRSAGHGGSESSFAARAPPNFSTPAASSASATRSYPPPAPSCDECTRSVSSALHAAG
mmetsp:Transcript_4609/g.16360  ORF Transcript_4609/g.16360 Transcript_4609/m.16360 type:complete len:205 (-) Transcript_4609:881-1495(-)